IALRLQCARLVAAVAERGSLSRMQQHSTHSPRYEEPFRHTLARNLTLAAVVGVVVAFLRRDVKLLLPVTTLALWFTLGGHYVELVFLNRIRDRLPRRRLPRALVRLLVWSCGGALLYECMAVTAWTLSVGVPP